MPKRKSTRVRQKERMIAMVTHYNKINEYAEYMGYLYQNVKPEITALCVLIIEANTQFINLLDKMNEEL